MVNLSPLQKYILCQGYANGAKEIKKDNLLKCSTKQPRKDAINILSKSIDRLIARGLVVGCGYKTSEKLFITSIKLTSSGRRAARQLMGVQQKLPFKNN